MARGAPHKTSTAPVQSGRFCSKRTTTNHLLCKEADQSRPWWVGSNARPMVLSLSFQEESTAGRAGISGLAMSFVEGTGWW